MGGKLAIDHDEYVTQVTSLIQSVDSFKAKEIEFTSKDTDIEVLTKQIKAMKEISKKLAQYQSILSRDADKLIKMGNKLLGTDEQIKRDIEKNEIK